MKTEKHNRLSAAAATIAAMVMVLLPIAAVASAVRPQFGPAVGALLLLYGVTCSLATVFLQQVWREAMTAK